MRGQHVGTRICAVDRQIALHRLGVSVSAQTRPAASGKSLLARRRVRWGKFSPSRRTNLIPAPWAVSLGRFALLPHRLGRVAQWIEHQPSKLRVAGSSPAAVAIQKEAPTKGARLCKQCGWAGRVREQPSLSQSSSLIKVPGTLRGSPNREDGKRKPRSEERGSGVVGKETQRRLCKTQSSSVRYRTTRDKD